MLILTRTTKQSIRIGDDVTISVLGVSGRKVRIGIDAPRDLPVHRSEIYDKIQNEAGHGGAVDTVDAVASVNTLEAESATDEVDEKKVAKQGHLYDSLIAKLNTGLKGAQQKTKETVITVKKRRRLFS